MERPDRNVWPTHERMKCICVFCGSNVGARDDYTNGACDLASPLVRDTLRVVYAGGRGAFHPRRHSRCGDGRENGRSVAAAIRVLQSAESHAVDYDSVVVITIGFG